jgi:hypothetical protein
MKHYYCVQTIGRLTDELFNMVIAPDTRDNKRIFKVSFTDYLSEVSIYHSLKDAKKHVKDEIVKEINRLLEKDIYKPEPLKEVLCNIKSFGVDWYEIM